MTYRILTICTGNICRSPMAEVVLADKLAEAGLDVEVDSAAVTAYEVGNPIDYRAAKTLRRAGYDVPDRQARRVTPEDFDDFDLILPMTQQHSQELSRLARRWGRAGGLAETQLFRTFTDEYLSGESTELDVPDPWYGSEADFVETLEIIESAVPAIIDHVARSV